ncbi:hypothetical protein B0T18DRAFT_400161 [Schizothecium vesticola]|uniref:Uncharacterized protein n=1 Tax=Schizothecium vesticola TaxID=314040 RepID=A0AA40FBQ9_9PEZI|nr:hypothetical protein B0T18DRAFT_400161 [Schizothecium vesticola]
MRQYLSSQFSTYSILNGPPGLAPKRPAFATPPPGVASCVVCRQVIPYSLQGPQCSTQSRCSPVCDEYFFQAYSYSVRDSAFPSPEARLLWPNRFVWSPPDRPRLAAPGRWALWDLIHAGTAGRQLGVIWTPFPLQKRGSVNSNFEHSSPPERKKPVEEWSAGGGSPDSSLSSVYSRGFSLKVWHLYTPSVGYQQLEEFAEQS